MNYSKPIPLNQVKITDEFWKNEVGLVRTEVLPYQWKALNDQVPGAAPSYCMRNFKLAGKINKARKEQGDAFTPVVWPLTFETLPADPEQTEERFYGFLFQDTDFSKWIEAAAYSLMTHPDEELMKIADAAIDIVCAAQQPDGYLDTYYILTDMSKIYTNLRDNHELYCFGHLTEGAVAYYQATGKDKLLKAAMRFADHIDDFFGLEEGKCKGYPGHEVAEMALARLYEVTGIEKYLKLSQFFIEQRGTRPYYFDKEHPETVKAGKEEALRHMYNQAHLPVREQKEAHGHSVRAVYLYSGMADIARLTGDESMLAACEELWDNITGKKMYITGGIGATHLGEAFSFPYDLPNDTAYAETCAAIGLVFFARRMLEISPHSKYGDVMERALYNGVLSGMALDGKSFFYVNPLEVYPEACRLDERKSHVKPVRQKWFGCACCPPNLARLLSSVTNYAYTKNDDTLFVHLYIGSEIETEFRGVPVQIRINSEFPWNGKVEIMVKADKPVDFKLALRIPDWCEGEYKQSPRPGDQIKRKDYREEVKDGYLYIEKDWFNDKHESFHFEMKVQAVMSHQNVRENIGKIAFIHGPLVYCLEEVDNGLDLHKVFISEDDLNSPKTVSGKINGQEMVFIKLPAKRLCDIETDSLYTKYQPAEYKDTDLTLVPYFAWNNRGEGEMRVWLPLTC